jgi:hypothetical protein
MRGLGGQLTAESSRAQPVCVRNERQEATRAHAHNGFSRRPATPETAKATPPECPRTRRSPQVAEGRSP